MLCEIRCGVDRAGGQRGVCGLAEHTPVYRRMIHFGEERPLVPSYVIWLSGCNFLCTFCSELQHLRPDFPGEVLSPQTLAALIDDDLSTSRHRVKNLNFVGGEPAISLPYIADVVLALLERRERIPPLLLNTNGYLSPAVLEVALDMFEIFVVDLKFGNDRCARRLGGPKRYVETLHRVLELLHSSGREVWIRHLLMPDHIDCCTRPTLEAVVQWPDFRVNLMPAFVAFDRRWRSLRRDEVEAARRLFEQTDLPHRYWDGRPLDLA
jgi:putative pyruvate formate lyase activating enzyme